jgi:DNA-binding GntR family transcriptional regulator
MEEGMTLEARPGARTLADVALAELREAIISGELEPGHPVRLQEQVERLDMSSVPIREALRFLERSGLIDRTPHRGAHVAEMSAQDLEETYLIRMELESMAVRLAAEQMTDDDRKELLELLDRFAAASHSGDDARTLALHADLHYALYRLSGSKWLLRLLPMLWDNSERYRRLVLVPHVSMEDRLAEHRLILEACAAGDPDAAEKALRDHLRRTFETAVERLRSQELQAAASSD